MRRLSRLQIEGTVQEAERQGRVLGVRLPPQEDDDNEPWTAPPSPRHKTAPIVGELPKTLELVLGNQIYIAKDGLPPGLLNRLLRLAAFQNPEFYQAQALPSPLTARRVSSPVPRIIRITSACREGVWRKLTAYSVTWA